MKANELRIGNLVEYGGDIFNIVEIGLCGALGTSTDGQFSSKFDNPNFEPIPLTEEWLLKLGFKKDENIIYKDPFVFKFYKNGKIEMKIWGIIISSNEKKWNRFKYVHQLQNMYFAITGEEL